VYARFKNTSITDVYIRCVSLFLLFFLHTSRQDKVKINSLSMVAEDHADSKQSAAALYDCIRKPLVSSNVSKERKLPLVYVLDSILKNVKGEFIPLVESDAKTWMPVVYQVLPEDQRKKLKRVWNMWRDAKLFSEANWKEMGECFSAPTTDSKQVRAVSTTPIRFPLSVATLSLIVVAHFSYYCIGGWDITATSTFTKGDASRLG